MADTPENLPDPPIPTVTGETVVQVHDWLTRGEMGRIVALASELPEVDRAGLLELSSYDDRQILIGLLKDQLTPEVLSHLDLDVREEVLERLPAKEIAAVVAELESDDALDIVEDLDDAQRAEVIANLPAQDRQQLEQALTYPEDSAGRIMQREVVAVHDDSTVGKIVDHILQEEAANLPPEFYDLIVIDPFRKVVGTVPLYSLLRASRSTKIRDIMREETRHIPVTMDREEVAEIFQRYRLQSAPVVDEQDKLLGVITIDDVVEVLQEEAEEDIRRMGGVGVEESIHDDVIQVTRSRFAWLFLNLLTAILASLAIGMFEASLQQVVALAVLMPIVASMGGNAGTQTLTVAVRALATKELVPSNYWRLVVREVRIGATNGLGFAVLVGLVAWGWFHSALIGLTIALAMVINLIAAGFSGAIIPIILRRFGFDPAVAGAVFLTTVTDIVGFVAFLGLATLILF
jgi:magnesium transporter